MPGKVMSSAYRARPVAFPIPSLRGTLLPTAGISGHDLDHHWGLSRNMRRCAAWGKIFQLMLLSGDTGASAWLRGRAGEVTRIPLGGAAVDFDTPADVAELNQD